MRRSPKPGSLDREHVQGATQLVDDQRGQGLAVDILGEDDERPAGLSDHLQRWQDIGDGADLLVGDQDEGLFKLGFHPLRAGGEVGGDVAAVDLHAFGKLGLELEPLRLLDRDHSLFADLLHDLADQGADLIVSGGDRGNLGDLFPPVDLGRHLLDAGDDGVGGQVETLLEEHGIGAGGDVAHALMHDGLGEDGRGGGAITGDVVGLGGRFLQELGAHVGEWVVKLDLFGNGDAVVGDGRGAVFLVKGDVAALRAEGGFNRVGEGIDAELQ